MQLFNAVTYYLIILHIKLRIIICNLICILLSYLLFCVINNCNTLLYQKVKSNK